MAWPANTGMLLPVALKMRDIRSASLIFQARRGYFWYFSITRSLSQLMFRQRRAQSQVFTTLRQFYPKFSGKWNINGQPWVPRTSSSIGTVAVSTQKKGSSSVPWLTRSLNLPFLPYSTDLTPCDFWLFHLLKDRLAAHVCRTSAKLYVQSWEVFPQSDCHRAFRAEKYSLEVTITEPSELRSILPKWLSQSLRWFVETFAITHTVQGRMLWKNVLLPWTCDQLFLFISLLSLFLNISDVDDVMVVIIDWTLLLIKVLMRRRG